MRIHTPLQAEEPGDPSDNLCKASMKEAPVVWGRDLVSPCLGAKAERRWDFPGVVVVVGLRRGGVYRESRGYGAGCCGKL